MRKRQLERVKNENEEQRHTQLEDIRQRTSEGVKNENEEQRLNENQPGQRESKRVKLKMIAMMTGFGILTWIRSSMPTIPLLKNKVSAICIS